MSLKTAKIKDSRKLEGKDGKKKRGLKDDQMINGRSEIKKKPRMDAKKATGMHD